jgi:hypothetical protein
VIARGTAAALAFATTLLGAAPPLEAAALTYSAPDVCPSQVAFVEEVERLVGHPLADIVGVDFAVEIGAKDRGFRATVRTRAAGVTEAARAREVTGATCDQAAQAAAVVVALAARTASAESAPEPEDEPETEPPPTEAGPMEPSPRGRGRQHEGATVDVTAGAAAVADAGALPGLAPGLAAEVGLAFSSARVLVQGVYILPLEHRIADGSGGRFTLAAGAVLACANRGVRLLLLAACAGFEAGVLAGEGVGLVRPASESSFWLAPRLEIRPGLNLGSNVRLFLGLGATVPLNRHRFLTNRQAVVHRASAVTGRFAAGAEMHF